MSEETPLENVAAAVSAALEKNRRTLDITKGFPHAFYEAVAKSGVDSLLSSVPRREDPVNTGGKKSKK